MYKKIIISFSINIILLLSVATVSVVKMIELSDLTEKLYKHPYVVSNATKSINSNLISMHRYMKDVALSHNLEELMVASNKVDQNEQIIYKEYEIIFQRYLGDRKDIETSFETFQNWKPIRDQVIQLMKQGKQKEASYITTHEGAIHVDTLNKQVTKLIDFAHNKAIYFYENAKKSKNDAIKLVVTLILLIVLIGIFILYLLIKDIQKTQTELKKHFHLIDQNIMSATIGLNFKIKDVSNAFARHLGYQKEDILAAHSNFLFEDCDEKIKQELFKTIRSGKEFQGEIIKRDSEHTIKWLFVEIHPMYNNNYKISGYTIIFHDITNKKEIELISNTDALTSLYNRRYFDTKFPQRIKTTNRVNAILVFCMIDIDHFKQYNDIYGHQAGDTTLKEVANALKKTLNRQDDLTFRLGGEEFGMLFNVELKEDGMKVINDARKRIESLKIEHKGNSVSPYVTISMGAYFISANNEYNFHTIYELADKLLYKAKQSGRNQVVTN